MTKNYERMKQQKVKLPEEALKELKELMDILYKAIKLMRKNLGGDSGDLAMKEVYRLEKQIDLKRDDIRQNHYKRLEKGIYDVQAGVIYLDFINRIEKIGDHLVNVNEAIYGLK